MNRRKNTASLLSAALVAMIAATALARTEYVTLWRGETAAKILHDYATVGAAPDGEAARLEAGGDR